MWHFTAHNKKKLQQTSNDKEILPNFKSNTVALVETSKILNLLAALREYPFKSMNTVTA